MAGSFQIEPPVGDELLAHCVTFAVRQGLKTRVPEGPTIHREARDQTPMLSGKSLAVCSPQGRFWEGAERLDGRCCTAIEAHGKHLFYRFGADTLHIHLGLYGRFRKAELPAPEPRGAVRIRMESPTHVVDCNGPTACEVLDDADVAKLLGRLGPDPLRDDADSEPAWARITKSKAPLGQLLLDQKVISGLGNIYRTEIPWRCHLHPEMPGRDLPRAVFDTLWADACGLLRLAVEAGRIITTDGAAVGLGRRSARFNIYKKKTCPRCSGAIRKFELASRQVFCCDACQTAR